MLEQLCDFHQIFLHRLVVEAFQSSFAVKDVQVIYKIDKWEFAVADFLD